MDDLDSPEPVSDKSPEDVDRDFLAGARQYVMSSNVLWLQYKDRILHVGYKYGGEYYCESLESAEALKVRKAISVGRALKELERTRGKFKRSMQSAQPSEPGMIEKDVMD